MVITLIVTFGLTWFPLYTLQFLIEFSTVDKRLVKSLLPFFQCLGTSNSAINPFLYVFMSPKFQKEIKVSEILLFDCYLGFLVILKLEREMCMAIGSFESREMS